MGRKRKKNRRMFSSSLPDRVNKHSNKHVGATLGTQVEIKTVLNEKYEKFLQSTIWET